ncbi:MAG TPA: hypothetical protein VIG72_14075 [Pontibacter sp.]
MKTIHTATIVLLITCSCGPKNKEVTRQQVETGTRTEALDSIANTRKDAVRTDKDTPAPPLP